MFSMFFDFNCIMHYVVCVNQSETNNRICIKAFHGDCVTIMHLVTHYWLFVNYWPKTMFCSKTGESLSFASINEIKSVSLKVFAKSDNFKKNEKKNRTHFTDSKRETNYRRRSASPHILHMKEGRQHWKSRWNDLRILKYFTGFIK